jgi:sarcosine oxidase subunit beta
VADAIWDCAIVGGGIVGCGVAWQLARAGRSVVLCEANRIASGASGGIGYRGVRANMRDERELPLARRANELWPDLGDMLGVPVAYERTGHLQLTEDPDAFARFEVQSRRQLEAGIMSLLLSRDDIARREPGIADTVVGALWCPDDGIAHHPSTTMKIARAARSLGAEVRTQTAVVSLETHVDSIALTTSTEEQITARSALIATGVHTDALIPGLPTFEVYPQAIVTESMNEPPVRHLIGHEERPLAIKALPDGRVMITGGRLGAKGKTSQEEVAANLADAIAMFPSLVAVHVEHAVADRAESIAPDMIPIIDRLDCEPRVLYATGWSGHGFAIAPAVSELLAEWLISRDRPELLAPFTATRF